MRLFISILLPIIIHAQYDYSEQSKPSSSIHDPYGQTAPPAIQPPPPPTQAPVPQPQQQQTITIPIQRQCADCPAPQVVVVVPEQPSLASTLAAQQQMMMLQSLGLGGGLGSFGLGNQQQQLQQMAMLHLMQDQGMSYYQQMQMLAMMQMARRFGGRPVPLQPVFRTTAEYSYPAKKIVFWPPYISTQPKVSHARPSPHPSPIYGPEATRPQIESSRYDGDETETGESIGDSTPFLPGSISHMIGKQEGNESMKNFILYK